MSDDTVWLVEKDAESCTLAGPACPACGEPLLVIGGPLRCTRCGLSLCESCSGEAYSD